MIIFSEIEIVQHPDPSDQPDNVGPARSIFRSVTSHDTRGPEFTLSGTTQPRFSMQVTSRTRRHMVAQADSLTTSEGWFGNTAGFGWDGGSPNSLIELDDYPDGVWPALAAVAYDGVLVTTTRITPEKFEAIDNPTTPLELRATGTAIMYEGEEEADYRVWRGKPSAGVT